MTRIVDGSPRAARLHPTLFTWLVGTAALLSTTACSVETSGSAPGTGSWGTTSAPEQIFSSDQGAPADFETAVAQETLGSGDLTVLMIVDRSSSMTGYWNGEPKWSTAQKALSKAIDGVEEQLTIGAMLFPQLGGCDVLPLEDPGQIQFQRGDTFRSRWELSNVSSPSGSTPLGLAFQLADQAILRAQESGLLDRRFRVVVVTDGEPSCGENPADLIAMADRWRESDVEVQVMGLPGSAAAAQLLQQIAGLPPTDFSSGEVPPPPPSVWTPDSGPDAGYIAPEDQDDVDDSLNAAVR